MAHPDLKVIGAAPEKIRDGATIFHKLDRGINQYAERNAYTCSAVAQGGSPPSTLLS
jgi:hypothetical protein